MFEEILGFTADERTLFYKVSDEIIRNFSGMGDETYFVRLEKAPGAKARVREIHIFPDYSSYADFFFAHKFEPHCLIFERRDNHVHVVMMGCYMFMAHEIYGSTFKYACIHERDPSKMPWNIPPRELVEKGFAEICGQLSSTKTPSTV